MQFLVMTETRATKQPFAYRKVTSQKEAEKMVQRLTAIWATTGQKFWVATKK